MSQAIAPALLCGGMDQVMMHGCPKENGLGRKSLFVRGILIDDTNKPKP
jgi:hypothetical protein